MKKSKKGHGEEHDSSSERWMLTYSDMITLLLALFIILYSMSTVEAKKFKELAQNFNSAFHGDQGGGGGGGTGTGNGAGAGTAGKTIELSSLSSGSASAIGGAAVKPADPLDEVYTTLSAYVERNDLEDQISLVNTDTYVQIRVKGVLMFYPDSPKMLESSKPIMDKISEVLVDIYDRVDHITISGNTADVAEVHTSQTDAFSWYLSINRADTVRKSLVANGLKEDKLSLEGHAHYNPVAKNDTEDGRAQNRRAEITVYKFAADTVSAASGASTQKAAEKSAQSEKTTQPAAPKAEAKK